MKVNFLVQKITSTNLLLYILRHIHIYNKVRRDGGPDQTGKGLYPARRVVAATLQVFTTMHLLRYFFLFVKSLEVRPSFEIV
jgi:hypothetical protein